MTKANETSSRECRFLSEDSFHDLYDTFIEAFSDYVFPFALTHEQFRSHMALNAVDITRSIGCFDADRLVGFSLNGFGDWKGRTTVYDAGTGVIPSARRQGVSRKMFETMMPKLERDGIEQFLLEVVTTNTAALHLYEKLGFKTTRTLGLLQCDTPVTVRNGKADELELRELAEPDWGAFLKFWSAEPSWQNSKEAVDRSSDRKRVIAAYIAGECVGYVIFSAGFGRISQLAVANDLSGHGIGRRLLQEVQTLTPPGFSLQIINADMSNPDVNGFFKSVGFFERLTQYEMVRQM